MYDDPSVVRVTVAVVQRPRHLCPTACSLHAAASPCRNASRRLSRVCAVRGMVDIWSNAMQSLKVQSCFFDNNIWKKKNKKKNRRPENLKAEIDLRNRGGHVF